MSSADGAKIALPPVGAFAHGGQPGQLAGLAGAVGSDAQIEGALGGVEVGPVDDGLVGPLHPVPLAFRGVDVLALPPLQVKHHL